MTSVVDPRVVGRVEPEQGMAQGGRDLAEPADGIAGTAGTACGERERGQEVRYWVLDRQAHRLERNSGRAGSERWAFGTLADTSRARISPQFLRGGELVLAAGLSASLSGSGMPPIVPEK